MSRACPDALNVTAGRHTCSKCSGADAGARAHVEVQVRGQSGAVASTRRGQERTGHALRPLPLPRRRTGRRRRLRGCPACRGRSFLRRPAAPAAGGRAVAPQVYWGSGGLRVRARCGGGVPAGAAAGLRPGRGTQDGRLGRIQLLRGCQLHSGWAFAAHKVCQALQGISLEQLHRRASATTVALEHGDAGHRASATPACAAPRISPQHAPGTSWTYCALGMSAPGSALHACPQMSPGQLSPPTWAAVL